MGREKAFLDVWDAELISAPPPQSPAPMTAEHSSPSPPFFPLPPLSSLVSFFSPPPLFRTQATPLYSRAFSFIVQFQGCISMLISMWLDWILKGRGSRRRWAAEREKTDRWAFRISQHGWENSSRKCDGWVGDFAPLCPERDYTWHQSDTGG